MTRFDDDEVLWLQMKIADYKRMRETTPSARVGLDGLIRATEEELHKLTHREPPAVAHPPTRPASDDLGGHRPTR
jgi:hypothetical protein